MAAEPMCPLSRDIDGRLARDPILALGSFRVDNGHLRRPRTIWEDRMQATE